MQISDLKDGMMVAELTVLVVEKRTANAKNGKPYADLVVRDQSGSIKCKWWNYKEEGDSVAVGKVYAIVGQVGSFAGDLQINLGGYEPSSKQPEDFAKSTRFKVEEMMADIQEAIDEFTEPLTQYVASKFIKNGGFTQAPAATGVHNAWIGGLLEHTWGMLQLAKPIVEHYSHMYGAKLSKDKVIFGVICHDVLKSYEYDYHNPAFPKTPDGVLVNHIVLGPAVIYSLAHKWLKRERLAEGGKEIDHLEFIRERNHLMHLVASHHGSLEWGSPVVPSTLEAVLLHQIDMIDSRFMHALELVEGKEGPIKGFSEKSWTQKTSFLK